MDVGQWVIIGLSIVMGVWYLVGATINRRRGIATYYWLRDGLEELGKITEARWIGSSGSGGRLTVGQANSPFRRVEVVFLLDSREILPLWLRNLLRGKQDEMILKANLRKMPGLQIEAARQGDRRFMKFVSSEDGRSLQRVSSSEGYEIAYQGEGKADEIARLSEFLAQFEGVVQQFSLQRQKPHLIIRAKLPSLRDEPAENFFAALKGWLR